MAEVAVKVGLIAGSTGDIGGAKIRIKRNTLAL
jgi:hypothetical protein